MKDDVELIAEYVSERSQDAFTELVRRHLDIVYAVALRRVGYDAHLAEDVTQVVFRALALKAGQLRRNVVLGAWLCRSVQFAARDVVRDAERRKAREVEAMERMQADRDEQGELDWEKARPLLDEAFCELSRSDRDAVWLRFFENRSFREIGERLRMKPNAARMRVTRAVDSLKAALGRRGIVSTSAAIGAVFSSQASVVVVPEGLLETASQFALEGASKGAAVATAKFWAYAKLSLGAALCGGAVWAIAHFALRGETEERDGRAEIVPEHVDTVEEPAALKPIEDRSPKLATSDEGEEPITYESVGARYARARRMEAEGELKEAIEEYFWLFDVGMVKAYGFSLTYSSIRTKELLDDLNRVSGVEPSVLSRLEKRRAAAELRLLSGQSFKLDLATVLGINRALEQESRSFEFYERLPPGSASRKALGRQIFPLLVEKRLYSDAASALSYRSMLGRIESMVDPVGDPENRSVAIDRINEDSLKRGMALGATYVETLVGAGRFEQATELIKMLLAIDDSPETLSLLEQRLSRVECDYNLDSVLKNDLHESPEAASPILTTD